MGTRIIPGSFLSDQFPSQWHETISLCCRHWGQHSHGKSQGANSCFARSSRHLPPRCFTKFPTNLNGIHVGPTQPNSTLPDLVGTSLPCKLIQGGDRVVGHHGSHNAWPGWVWMGETWNTEKWLWEFTMDMPEDFHELEMERRFEISPPPKKKIQHCMT